MTLSTYGRNFNAAVLTGQASAPASWYLMLLTSIPDPAEPMVTTAAREPAGASYERIPIYNDPDYWSDPTGGESHYTDLTTFLPEEDWGVITCWGLATASVAGTLYRFGALVNPVNAIAGATLKLDGYPRIEVPA